MYRDQADPKECTTVRLNNNNYCYYNYNNNNNQTYKASYRLTQRHLGMAERFSYVGLNV